MKTSTISLALAALLGQGAWATTVTINDPQGPVSTYVDASPMEKETHVIGVYDAYATPSGDDHQIGTAHVHIAGNADGMPIKLVLSAYESTNWVLDGNVSSIGLLILNGYSQSTVSGIESWKVFDKTGMGNYLSACTFEWSSEDQGCSSSALTQGLYNISNATVTSFTGTYRATDFTVHVGAVPEASALAYCAAGLSVLAWSLRRSRRA